MKIAIIAAVALLAILFEVGRSAGAEAETCEDKKSRRWCDRRCNEDWKCREKKACRNNCKDYCDRCPEEPETPTTTVRATCEDRRSEDWCDRRCDEEWKCSERRVCTC